MATRLLLLAALVLVAFTTTDARKTNAKPGTPTQTIPIPAPPTELPPVELPPDELPPPPSDNTDQPDFAPHRPGRPIHRQRQHLDNTKPKQDQLAQPVQIPPL